MLIILESHFITTHFELKYQNFLIFFKLIPNFSTLIIVIFLIDLDIFRPLVPIIG